MSSLFLAGASRNLGFEIAQSLAQQNIPTTALLRNPDHQTTLESLGIQTQLGDALNPEDLDRAMASGYHTVISTIGGISPDGIRSDFLGNRNLIDRAIQIGIQHFILITSIGAGESAKALPESTLQALSAALVEKNKTEEYLRSSGLTYTIIRPGGLKSEPATGQGILTLDCTVGGLIHRADAAQLIWACIQNPRAHNQTLSAIDQTKMYGDRAIEKFDLNHR